MKKIKIHKDNQLNQLIMRVKALTLRIVFSNKLTRNKKKFKRMNKFRKNKVSVPSFKREKNKILINHNLNLTNY